MRVRKARSLRTNCQKIVRLPSGVSAVTVMDSLTNAHPLIIADAENQSAPAKAFLSHEALERRDGKWPAQTEVDSSPDPSKREEQKLVFRPGTYVIKEVSTRVPNSKIGELLPLNRREWRKIENMLDAVKPPSLTFQNIAFASVGVFPTALTFLIGLKFVQSVPVPVWILAWVLTVISPIVFLIAFIASRQSRQVATASIEIVKAEMAYIEDQYEWHTGDGLQTEATLQRKDSN
jgi:hypothetical protein